MQGRRRCVLHSSDLYVALVVLLDWVAKRGDTPGAWGSARVRERGQEELPCCPDDFNGYSLYNCFRTGVQGSHLAWQSAVSTLPTYIGTSRPDWRQEVRVDKCARCTRLASSCRVEPALFEYLGINASDHLHSCQQSVTLVFLENSRPSSLSSFQVTFGVISQALGDNIACVLVILQ